MLIKFVDNCRYLTYYRYMMGSGYLVLSAILVPFIFSIKPRTVIKLIYFYNIYQIYIYIICITYLNENIIDFLFIYSFTGLALLQV